MVALCTGLLRFGSSYVPRVHVYTVSRARRRVPAVLHADPAEANVPAANNADSANADMLAALHADSTDADVPAAVKAVKRSIPLGRGRLVRDRAGKGLLPRLAASATFS